MFLDYATKQGDQISAIKRMLDRAIGLGKEVTSLTTSSSSSNPSMWFNNKENSFTFGNGQNWKGNGHYSKGHGQGWSQHYSSHHSSSGHRRPASSNGNRHGSRQMYRSG